MDISSNKQAKSHRRKLGHGKEKGKLKRETESLLIAAQNNTIWTNHVMAKIDKTQQNSKYRICGDRDEMNNHIFCRITLFLWACTLKIKKQFLVSKIKME